MTQQIQINLLKMLKNFINDGIFLLEFADLASIIKYKMFDTICHEHLNIIVQK